jgi:hypothetical protein
MDASPTWQPNNTFMTRPIVALPSLPKDLSATGQWSKGAPISMVIRETI